MNNWKDKIKRKGLGIAPQEVSANLQAPELAPSDKRITGRTKQLGLSVKPEFAKRLKFLAAEEDCFVIEVLEKALECYEKHRNKENHSQPSKESEHKISQKSKEIKKPTQQLNQFWKVNFICNKCQQKFERAIVYSLAPNLDQLKHYHTYCVNCKETTNEETEENNNTSPLIRKNKSDKPCSFFISDQQNEIIFCDKPVFDKKKQLCRSHNKQVWKRFHEFLKDESVSGAASWYEVWNQSGDWKYFWNLGGKKK